MGMTAPFLALNVAPQNSVFGGDGNRLIVRPNGGLVRALRQ
jgi:hypothetical protein